MSYNQRKVVLPTDPIRGPQGKAFSPHRCDAERRKPGRREKVLQWELVLFGELCERGLIVVPDALRATLPRKDPSSELVLVRVGAAQFLQPLYRLTKSDFRSI